MPASTTGPQRSNLTHVDGVAVQTQNSLQLVAGVRAIKHLNVSFGTGETGDKVSSISALGAVSAEEVQLMFSAEQHKATDSSVWQVRARVTSNTEVTFTKEDVTPGSAGSASPSTHYFHVIRWVK